MSFSNQTDQIYKNKFFISIILVLILILAVFFRSYQAYERFDFGHDGDLYSWIVKDIVVDKHIRLIGQLTSSDGIFIGPLFYYLIIPFFLLTNMEPTGLLAYAVILGIMTTISFYYVFKKLFSQTAGLIASFVHATFMPRVTFDRWIVPTITVSIWEVWYFFVLVNISRGNFSYLFLLGILIGLIWHIHIALAPILLCIPFAIFFSKKRPKLKDLYFFVIGLFIPSVPLIVFEVKHGFIQTRSFIALFNAGQYLGNRHDALIHVLQQVSGNFYSTFFYPDRGNYPFNLIILILFLFSAFFLIWKKAIDKKNVALVLIWIFSMIGFFTFSTKIISEYYFHNLEIMYLFIFISWLTLLFTFSKITKLLVIFFLLASLIWNLHILIGGYHPNKLGFKERKEVVTYIKQDSLSKKFPCVAISYIAPVGGSFGFRYLLYYNDLYIVSSESGAPIYTIVLSERLDEEGIKKIIGGYGIIPPRVEIDQNKISSSCQSEDVNLNSSMFGLTK